MFEKKMLRRISGDKRDEVTRGWRKYLDKLHNFCSSAMLLG
jgi:hypothetical protein